MRAGARSSDGEKTDLRGPVQDSTGEHVMRRREAEDFQIAALIRNCEVVYSTGGRASGALACHLARRRRLLTGAHKEGVLSWLQLGVERNLVDADANVLGSKRQLLLAIDS